MHDDQLDIDTDVVRELIATQFPEWSGEPLTRVHGSGTVNAIFRIGDRLAARFPLRGTDAATAAQLRAEASAMEELAEHSPFPVPRHVAMGRPGSGYPLHWSVQTWLDGDDATPDGTRRLRGVRRRPGRAHHSPARRRHPRTAVPRRWPRRRPAFAGRLGGGVHPQQRT